MPTATLNDYRCGSCGADYRAVENISDFSYGVFLARGMRSDLPACTEPLAEACGEVFDHVIGDSRLRGRSDAHVDAIRAVILTLIADPLPNGEQPTFGIRPRCPGCLARKPASWGEVEPIQDEEIAQVFFSCWGALTAAHKKAVVDQYVSLILAD